MRLVQVALHADDLDRAAAFYSRLLGDEPRARFDPPGLLFFDLEGTRLLLDRNAPSALIYLGVDDVHATIDAIRDEVRVVAEPHAIFTHEDDRSDRRGTRSGRRSSRTRRATPSGSSASYDPRPAERRHRIPCRHGDD